MQPSNLANIEAILNICANLTEIAGIRYAIGFALAAILILFLRKWKIAGSYFLLGIVVAIVGLATPGIINWLVASLRDAHLESWYLPLGIVAGILALIVFVVALALFAYPVRVAKKRGKTRFGWIIGLSLASILFAPLWSVALFLAYRDEKESDKS